MGANPSILISGAGPVGLTAALELARRGFAPRIIDRDGLPSPESRALAVNARTLDLLAPSGVAETILAKCHRVNRFIVRDNGKERLRIELKHAPHKYNFLAVLPQSETEAILIAALQARGIAVSWNTELTDIAIDGAGFSCNGARHDLLIGADGAHSLVRKSLGIGFPGESAGQAFMLADVELEDWPFPFDCAVASLTGTHISGFIPMGEGVGRFVGNAPGIAGLFPPEARVKRTIWESRFAISYRQASSYHQGSGFLAGDAAHIHSPIGGRGMNLGIEDACWLAWLIAEGRAGEYTGLRHPACRTVLAQTQGLTRFITSPGVARSAALRFLLPVALGLPPLRRAILKRLTGQDTPFAPWISP